MRLFIPVLGFMIIGVMPVRAAQIVNVDYIVKYTKQKWNVDVPYKSEQKYWAANTAYLLGVIDWVNKKINNEQTSDYATTEFATNQAADTIAANAAIDRLVKIKPVFWFVPATSDANYSFSISAAGIYGIDWGDGSEMEIIKKTTATAQVISHTFPGAANGYTIGLGGRAMKYSAGLQVPAITFNNAAYRIKRMDGCLGCIFSTLPNGDQPLFYYTFASNTALSGPIPENLFVGIKGEPSNYMFSGLFMSCTGLTGGIPEDLFAGIDKPGYSAFSSTFRGCSGLTGTIPYKLFGRISGKPQAGLFNQTFSGCSGLGGALPDKLFAGISGAPAKQMFQSTFNGTSITSIPDNLFGDISGNAVDYMFYRTFYSCKSLTGESAKINGKYLYEIWPDATGVQVGGCYYLDSKLTDYADMPKGWK